MMTKIIAVTDGSYDDHYLVSIVRAALLKAGVTVDSVDAEQIHGNAVLWYRDREDGILYLLAIPSRGDNIDWTSDIDEAKICDGPRSIQQCRAEILKRIGVTAEIRYI